MTGSLWVRIICKRGNIIEGHNWRLYKLHKTAKFHCDIESYAKEAKDNNQDFTSFIGQSIFRSSWNIQNYVCFQPLMLCHATKMCSYQFKNIQHEHQNMQVTVRWRWSIYIYTRLHSNHNAMDWTGLGMNREVLQCDKLSMHGGFIFGS